MALSEEEFGEVGGEGGGDAGASDLAQGGASANRAEFVGVVGVFVKGDEAVGAEQLGNGRGNLVVEEEGDDFGEGGEVGVGGFLVGLGGGGAEGAGFEGVGEVSEGATGGAAGEGGEGFVEDCLVEGASEGGGWVRGLVQWM